MADDHVPGDAGPPGPTSRVTPAVVIALLTVFTMWIGWTRRAGLLPPALVQDDLWVALLAKYGTPADLVRFVAPVPMGFVAALMISGRLVSEPTLALQLVSFVSALCLIPLSAWMTRRLTGRWEVALLAAVFVALHPLGGDYAVRVKQFTWDAALVVALVGYGLPYLDPREARRSWPLAAVAASALVLSFATVFAGAVLCHVRALRSLLRREDRVSGNARAAVVAALAWDGFAVLLYVVRLRHQSPAWLVDYWRKQYSFPTYAPSLAHGIDAHWLVPAMQRAFDTWLGYGWWRLAALSGLGIVALLLQPRRRWQGLFFAIFFLCPPIAGLLLLFPFGGGRTDYSYQPLLAALGAVGIGALARVLAAPLARLGRAGQIGARLRTAIPLVAIVICLVVRPVPATQYGGLRDPVTSEVRDLVATLDEIARPDDLVLLTPYSLWNVAYYTRLPMEIDFSRPDAKLFLVNLIRPRSLHVGRPRAALASSGVPDRVILVSLYTLPPVMPMYEQDFEQASYERTFEKSIYYKGSKTSTVQVWTRRRTADGS